MRRLTATLLALVLALSCFCPYALASEDMSIKYIAAQKLLYERKYDEAIAAFDALFGYEDSSKFIIYCKCLKLGDAGQYELAAKNLAQLGDFKDAKLEIIYYEARALEDAMMYEQAGVKFLDIILFRDSFERHAALPDKILERDYQAAHRALMSGGNMTLGMSEMQRLIDATYSTSQTKMINDINSTAADLYNAAEYETAKVIYALLAERGYPQADERVIECRYQIAISDEQTGDLDAACREFLELGDYADCKYRYDIYNIAYYAAMNMIDKGEYQAALTAFKALNNFSDSQNYALYAEARTLEMAEKYKEAAEIYSVIQNCLDSEIRRESAIKRAVGELISESQKVISTKNGHTIGLKSDGTVLAVGRNGDGQCNVSGWTDIVSVCAGGNHSVGLKSDGTVLAVGHNGYGQCNVSGWTDIVAVSAGSFLPSV